MNETVKMFVVTEIKVRVRVRIRIRSRKFVGSCILGIGVLNRYKQRYK